MIDMDSDSRLRFTVRYRGANDSSLASHPHFLAQRNFGRHRQSELDCRAFFQRILRVNIRAAGAQVLSAASNVYVLLDYANGYRKVVLKSLSDTAFQLDLFRAHGILHPTANLVIGGLFRRRETVVRNAEQPEVENCNSILTA